MNILNRIVSILGLSLSLFLAACGGSSGGSGGGAAGPSLLDGFISCVSGGSGGGAAEPALVDVLDGFIDHNLYKGYNKLLSGYGETEPEFSYFVFIGTTQGDLLFLQGIKQPSEWDPEDRQAALDISSDEEFLVPKAVAERNFIPEQKFHILMAYVSAHLNELPNGLRQEATRGLIKAIVGSDIEHLTQYPQADYYRLVQVYVSGQSETVFKNSAEEAFSGAKPDCNNILPLTYGAYITLLPYPKLTDNSPDSKIADFYYRQIKTAKIAPEALIDGKFLSPYAYSWLDECSYDNWVPYCGHHQIFDNDMAKNEFCTSDYSDYANDPQYLLYTAIDSLRLPARFSARLM